jgi:alpha-L-arabinofuranosidase
LRKQNGRSEPWKVKYWALGNEIDGPWQMGHKSAEDYGKFALEAAKLMKWTDPDIKLVAAGSSNFGNGIDWVGWNRTVLDFLKSHADYLSMHTYVGNTGNDYGEFLANSILLQERIKTTEGTINAALAREPRNRKIHIAWDEWNVWYRARGSSQQGRRILEERYNLEDALVVATFLNTFVNNAHTIKIANMAQLVNVIAPIFTDEKRIFLQTIYYPLALFAANTKGTALELLVKSPTYPSSTFGEVPHLDASAAIDNGTLVVNVVNRHRDQPVEADIELQDRQFDPSVEVSEVNAADVKAENSFDSTLVRTVNRNVAAESKVLRYRFPAHSYTMLKARLV